MLRANVFQIGLIIVSALIFCTNLTSQELSFHKNDVYASPGINRVVEVGNSTDGFVDYRGIIYRGFNIPRIPLMTVEKIDNIDLFDRSTFKNIIISQFGLIFDTDFFENYHIQLSRHSLSTGSVSMPMVKNDGTIYLFQETSSSPSTLMFVDYLLILLLPRIETAGDFERVYVTRHRLSPEDYRAGFTGLYTKVRISVRSPIWSADVEPEIIHKVKSTSSILDETIWSKAARDLLSSYTAEFFKDNFLLMIQIVSDANQFIDAGWVHDDGKIQFQKRNVFNKNRIHNFFFEFDKKFANVEFYVDFR
jgi:hypothetical protein